MCFSARMSFLAAGLLASIAIATYRKVRTVNEIPFASIPLVFGIQQALEGFLWILLAQGISPALSTVCMYGFLGFALLFWPFFIPFSILLIEREPLRRVIMGFCLILGSVWSLTSLWYLVHKGAHVSIDSQHIAYQLPGFEGLSGLQTLICYCAIVLTPFLVASEFSLRLVGCFIGIACFVSYFAWYYYFTSIWCFFAAFISLSIYGVMMHREQSSTPKRSVS
jgi:hypothetical protein